MTPRQLVEKLLDGTIHRENPAYSSHLMENAMWSNGKTKEFVPQMVAYQTEITDKDGTKKLIPRADAVTKRLGEFRELFADSYELVYWATQMYRVTMLNLVGNNGNAKAAKKCAELVAGYTGGAIFFNSNFNFCRGAIGQIATTMGEIKKTIAKSEKAKTAFYAIKATDDNGKLMDHSVLYDKLHGINQLISSIEALPQGEPIVEFPDGSKWVILDKHGCEQEGKLMRHCGNSGGNKADRLMSYREPSASYEGLLEPKMTFILGSNGMIGEMKGYANNKPAAKYHEKILALLELPMIKGTSGKGYKPEANFSIADLNDEQRLRLAKSKPDFKNTDGMFDFEAFKAKHGVTTGAKKVDQKAEPAEKDVTVVDDEDIA
jgi:hypothetical protein